MNSCSSDLKINLPKCTTLHLTPLNLLEILALSLTNVLPSLTKLHLSPKPVTITFVSFAVYGLTSICQLPIATYIVHSKLDYWNFLYYKLFKSVIPSPADPELSCSYGH